MVSPTLFAVVAVLLFSATQHAAHCQEQNLGFGLSLRVPTENIGGVSFCRLNINGRESFIINGPDRRDIAVPAGSTVSFNNLANRVEITNGGTRAVPTTRYQYLLQVPPFLFQEFTNTDNTGESGPGTVYSDGETSLFTNSTLFRGLFSQVESQCPTPPPQCNITTPEIGNELVLNIRCFPSDPTEGNGNILELTGSRSIEIGTGESLTYASNTLRYRRGSTTRELFENIRNFVVLEDVRSSFTGATGQRVSRFSGDSNQVITGPGILRIGESQGLGTAFFSSSATGNAEINSGVVDQQLNISSIPDDNVVRISDIFPPSSPPLTQLIDLGGTVGTTGSSYRERSFPTATRITYNNGVITVFDRFGQTLASLRGYASLSAFVNSRTQSFIGNTNGDLAVEGLTLYTNRNAAGQEQAFGFSGIESSTIQNRINTALSDITVPVNERPGFSIRGFGDGSAVLSDSATRREIVTVTDRVIPVGSGQFVGYDGTQFRVYRQTDPNVPIAGTPIAASSFTVFETVPQAPGSFFTEYNSTNVPTQDFAGPGIIYTDNNGRAFYTNDQQTINFVNGFVNSLPPAIIRTTVDTVDNTRVVNIENSNRRLVQASSSTTTNVGPSQGVLYTGNTVRTVNGFSVPSGSRVVDSPSSTPGQRVVQVVSPNGQIQFTTTTSNYRQVQGGVYQPVPANSSLPGGGVIYFNPNGGNVVYSTDSAVTPGFVTNLGTTGGITFSSTFTNITELNFYDGQRVIRYPGSSTNFIQGPGTIFTSSSTNQALFSTSTSRNNQIAGEISRLIPVTFNVTTTNGQVRVISGTGSSIFTFTIGSTRNINVGGTGSVTYSNGVLVTPGGNISTTSFIYFNGFETRRFMTGAEVSFMGPGTITVNERTGEVIFITDETTTQRINNRITSTTTSAFRPPVLVRPETSIETSKFSTVPALFGQTVNVYQSANVELRCQAGQGVPNPDFEFYRNGSRLFGNESRIMITMPSSTVAILTIFDVMPEDEVRYECRARNSAGRDRIFTDIRVRPAVSPMIVNNYFPVSPERPGRTITARNPPYTVPIVVIDPVDTGIPIIPNSPVITNFINVACKGDGLPKATIEWTVDGMEPGNDTEIIEPRPGRSILRVDVRESSDTTQYECSATNGAGEATGTVFVEATSYTCEGRTPGSCSTTCGFGLQEMIPNDCMRRRGGILTPIPASELPVGLFETIRAPCFTGVQCPVVTFRYIPGTFEQCSRTCGGGIQRRSITCERFIDGVSTNETVDNMLCVNFGLTPPVTVQRCNIERCPRWVINSEFTPCSSTCAGGTRSRSVTCMQMLIERNDTTGDPILGSDGKIVRNDSVVPDSFCDIRAMPRRMESCNDQVLCPHRWAGNPWEPCAEDFCQTRTLTCTRFDTNDPGEQWPLNDTFCAGIPRINTVRSCGGGVCNRGEFRAMSRSPCSVTCGLGVRLNNNIRCFIGAEPVEDGFCDPNQRPLSGERCILFNCPGRCDFEPDHCRVYGALRLCKSFEQDVLDCCRSCSLQARPITLPPFITQDSLMLSIDQRRFFPSINEVEVCCIASSTSSPNGPAFLPFQQNCTLNADINMVTIERQVVIDRVRDNTACTTFPVAGLLPGAVFEVSVVEDITIANVTVPTL